MDTDPGFNYFKLFWWIQTDSNGFKWLIQNNWGKQKTLRGSAELAHQRRTLTPDSIIFKLFWWIQTDSNGFKWLIQNNWGKHKTGHLGTLYVRYLALYLAWPVLMAKMMMITLTMHWLVEENGDNIPEPVVLVILLSILLRLSGDNNAAAHDDDKDKDFMNLFAGNLDLVFFLICGTVLRIVFVPLCFHPYFPTQIWRRKNLFVRSLFASWSSTLFWW